MRLIVFVKTSDSVDPIPLDIIDERPAQTVLDDIIRLIKPSVNSGVAANYGLAQNGKEIDLTLKLSENGVKNGDHLELVPTSAKLIANNTVVEKTSEQQISSVPQTAAVNSKVKPKTNRDIKPVIGKKIDFD